MFSFKKCIYNTVFTIFEYHLFNKRMWDEEVCKENTVKSVVTVFL